MEMSSSSLFSSGVPVRTMAWGLSMRLIARAAMVFQFLTRCASSTMTSSGAYAWIRSRSVRSFS